MGNKVNNTRDMSSGSGQYPVKGESFRTGAKFMVGKKKKKGKKGGKKRDRKRLKAAINFIDLSFTKVKDDGCS